MNRTSKAVSVAAALLCVAGTGCTDPTVAPKSTVTSANVFNDPTSYRAFLAKIYGRLLRPLGCADGIDLFGNLTLVTEADPLGATPPKQATRDSLYRYVVTELNAIKDALPPKGAATYGRATPAAAHMLLAKLYLNAGVYTGTPNYAGALTEAQAVIAAGYTIDPSFVHNFQADNNTSPELVFVAPQDGKNTQTWGGMTFLIHAGCGGSMAAANYGIDYCWGGYRMKQQVHNLFAAGDGRASFFYTTGQQVNVDTIGQFSNGIAGPKFTNKTSGGVSGSQSGMVDTDVPIFSTAEAYLDRKS